MNSGCRLVAAPRFERVAVTALTEIATTRALAVANQGLAGRTGLPIGNRVMGAPTAAQAHAANAQIANLYGLVGLDIARTIPSDILDERSEDDAPAMQHYGLVNAGFSQLALSAAGDNDTLDVVAAAAADYSNGVFDGLAYGEERFPSLVVGLPGNPLFTQTSAAFCQHLRPGHRDAPRLQPQSVRLHHRRRWPDAGGRGQLRFHPTF